MIVKLLHMQDVYHIIFPFFRAPRTVHPVPLFLELFKLRYTISSTKNVFHKQIFPLFFFSYNSFMHTHSVFIICRWFTHSRCRSRARTEKHKSLFLLCRALKLIVKWALASRTFFLIFF